MILYIDIFLSRFIFSLSFFFLIYWHSKLTSIYKIILIVDRSWSVTRPKYQSWNMFDGKFCHVWKPSSLYFWTQSYNKNHKEIKRCKREAILQTFQNLVCRYLNVLLEELLCYVSLFNFFFAVYFLCSSYVSVLFLYFFLIRFSFCIAFFCS